MKRSPLPPRRTPLARQSSRRRAERSQRAAVVAASPDRDGGCIGAVVASWVPCRGRMVVHEVAQRSVVPGSHLRPELCVALCSGHHHWAHENIEDARLVGLIVDSWDVQP